MFRSDVFSLYAHRRRPLMFNIFPFLLLMKIFIMHIYARILFKTVFCLLRLLSAFLPQSGKQTNVFLNLSMCNTNRIHSLEFLKFILPPSYMMFTLDIQYIHVYTCIFIHTVDLHNFFGKRRRGFIVRGQNIKVKMMKAENGKQKEGRSD